MLTSIRQLWFSLFLTASVLQFAGCGTTRSSDTTRTATEQLLISDAIDRAVQSVDLKTLAGQKVFLDDSRLGEVIDRNYLISTLRQHLLANGCQLRDTRDQADFIVEARAGAVGTDRSDLLFGVPSMNVPQVYPLQPVPGAVIPEIPIAKRKDQKAIAKIAVFAYHRETGSPVWQSGLVHQESTSNDVWIMGAGPFQRGSIYDGTAFAGKALEKQPMAGQAMARRLPETKLARENVFTPPQQLTKAPDPMPPATAATPAPTPVAPQPAEPVQQAAYQEPQAVADRAVAEPKAVAASDPATKSTVPAPKPVTPSETATAAVSPDVEAKVAPAYTPGGTSPLPQPRFSSR